jgi:hypothetical protein
MKKLQPKQLRVKFSTRLLLEGITPISRASLRSRSSLWKLLACLQEECACH